MGPRVITCQARVNATEVGGDLYVMIHVPPIVTAQAARILVFVKTMELVIQWMDPAPVHLDGRELCVQIHVHQEPSETRVNGSANVTTEPDATT